MFLIGATQKVQNELKRDIVLYEDYAENELNQWHVNLFKKGRYKCLIFIHDASLYTVVIPKVRKEHFKNIEQVFLQKLHENLISDRFSEDHINQIISMGDEIVFTKTRSRSVIGCIVDQMKMIEYGFESVKEFSPDETAEINQFINRTPYSPLYKSEGQPVKELMKYLSDF
ncbi:hypothetical protein [Alkalihalobacillus sp. AL-G]|uniref:DUF6933 domain-containing protein n=1 Tax=Alkalihalobacillus sp. AL-G TaxID=2926399 RepID=UPI00272CC413|nr:hypothetical protein [Alkalihalobacillus sp. AL-G]WLD93314.1 hypothetical protein MOJ78_20350 [Alkalihalobacillus sp. AL-G]